MSNFFYDNLILLRHIEDNHHFHISRLGGHECDVIATMQNQPALESNSGIRCTTSESLQRYVESCKKSYASCTLICDWDKKKTANCYTHGQDYILDHVIPHHIPRCNAVGLSVFEYFDDYNWLQGLKGKSILIISPFVQTIKKQLLVQDKLFTGKQYDWFYDCTFSFVIPPVTLAGNHQNKEWYEHYEGLIERIQISQLENDFEVALVSCGGYGIPICGFIYNELQRSAIYMGGALQIIFGIMGGRWEYTNKFINEYWVRPSEEERPPNYKSIEGGCYW